jgi:hypothetical protein
MRHRPHVVLSVTLLTVALQQVEVAAAQSAVRERAVRESQDERTLGAKERRRDFDQELKRDRSAVAPHPLTGSGAAMQGNDASIRKGGGSDEKGGNKYK